MNCASLENDTNIATANEICTAARQWIGTPFHLHGRSKQVGCDCLGFIIGVAEELGLRTKYGQLLSTLDRNDYHIIHDGRLLEKALNENFDSVSMLAPGQMVLLKYDNNPQHLGILADYPAGGLSIIHAHMTHRMVVEHRLDDELKENIKSVYRFMHYTNFNN